MTSRRPLLILRSEGQRSRSPWPCELKNGFRSITEERLGPGTPYLVCRLVMPSGRSLLILSSVGLKSRSQWPWAERSQLPLCEKYFPLNNWGILGPRIYMLGIQDGHTSRRPLLNMRSVGQRSRSRSSDDLVLKNGFRSITEEHLGPGTSYLVCRLVMTPIDFEVKGQGHSDLELKNGFRSITEE